MQTMEVEPESLLCSLACLEKHVRQGTQSCFGGRGPRKGENFTLSCFMELAAGQKNQKTLLYKKQELRCGLRCRRNVRGGVQLVVFSFSIKPLVWLCFAALQYYFLFIHAKHKIGVFFLFTYAYFKRILQKRKTLHFNKMPLITNYLMQATGIQVEKLVCSCKASFI